MRFYFLSGENAALKLNGLFLGFIGSFEKFTDITLSERILVEILPENSAFYPVSFVLDEKFLEKPADFCNVYIYDEGVIIEIINFTPHERELKILKQERIANTLLTLYDDGKPKLTLENDKNFTIETLPFEFEDCEFFEYFISGERFIAVCLQKDDEKILLVFSDDCKKVFANNVLSFSFDEALYTKISYKNPARHVAEIKWIWQNEFTIADYSVKATREFLPDEIPNELLSVLFFNEILVRGEPEKYLCENLKSRSNELNNYLNNFIGVCQPPENFLLLHPETISVGLVFQKSKNKFEIKFFGIDVQDGKIANIFPAI